MPVFSFLFNLAGQPSSMVFWILMLPFQPSPSLEHYQESRIAFWFLSHLHEPIIIHDKMFGLDGCPQSAGQLSLLTSLNKQSCSYEMTQPISFCLTWHPSRCLVLEVLQHVWPNSSLISPKLIWHGLLKHIKKQDEPMIRWQESINQLTIYMTFDLQSHIW